MWACGTNARVVHSSRASAQYEQSHETRRDESAVDQRALVSRGLARLSGYARRCECRPTTRVRTGRCSGRGATPPSCSREQCKQAAHHWQEMQSREQAALHQRVPWRSRQRPTGDHRFSRAAGAFNTGPAATPRALEYARIGMATCEARTAKIIADLAPGFNVHTRCPKPTPSTMPTPAGVTSKVRSIDSS